MIEKYIYEQNVHWQNQPYDAGIIRESLKSIQIILDTDQTIAISGVRRCGKSFLLKQIINQLIDTGIRKENILFVNLELPFFSLEQHADILDKIVLEYKKMKNPQGKIYYFLDEIQAIPNWEIWLKYNYDLYKGKVKYFITGSNSQLLSSEFATKLSGRVIEKKLYPFSFNELLTYYDLCVSERQDIIRNKEQIMHYFDMYLNFGSMPETLANTSLEIKRELLSSYLNAILFKDIVPRFSVRDSMLIQNLTMYLMGNTTTLLNYNKLANILHSNRNTIRDYINYIEKACLNFSLAKFDYSQKAQLLSSKKSYFIDNGFINLLAFRFSLNQGHLLENIVFLHLKRTYDHVYYYKNKGECDFIVYQYMKEKMAVQVTYTLNDNNRKRELKGVKLGCEKIDIKEGYILTYNDYDTIQYDGIKVFVLPVFDWLLKNFGSSTTAWG
ncbi:MAG: ATPase [Candidatus Magnetoglobus multicellularis str. Araruama]|uniref:ATPase n=1 Tax=Candidatus Magnetoglobus multicellularis str. Araruama TaxID=890399 RepID=A0A1V1PEZ1_9BACT|nr:MAG: ATPase [Candidatus Magnetoglobus multicellularis str. Araruama]